MQHRLQHTNSICLGGGQPLVGPGLACGGTRELAQKGHSGTAYVLCLQTFEFRQRLGHAPQFPKRYSTMITQPGLCRGKLQSGIEMVQACTGIDGCRSRAKMCLDHDVPSCGAGARIVGPIRCSSANTLRIQRLECGRKPLTTGPDVIRQACCHRGCSLPPSGTHACAHEGGLWRPRVLHESTRFFV